MLRNTFLGLEPTLMNTPPPIQTSGTPWNWVIAWGIVAAIAGLLCVAVPPFLFPGANHPAYGHPLIPWFAIAFANLHVMATMPSLFVLGMVLGVAQPRQWLLLGCLTISLPTVLNAINILHDWTIDPTDHNLFPFEFVILAFVGSPALLGTFLGSRIGRANDAR